MSLRLDEPFRWGGQVATPQPILPIPHEGMAVAAKAATGWQNFYNGENQPLSAVTRSPAKMMREAQATYYANPWIRRAESTVSSKVSGLPWHLEDANADEVDDETPNPALQQLHDLLEKPQAALPPEQRQPGISTWRGLLNITSRHMGLCGPAYWFLDQMDQGGLPLALIYINPARMTADVTRTGNLLGWRLDADDYGQGGTPLRVDQVLPFYLDVPDFGAMTTGLVATAALKARIVTASDVHILSVLGTGGRIAALISPKDGYIDDPDRFAQLERDFRLINEAPDAAKRTSIVRGPIDYHQMGADLRQLGLEQLATLARDDIFATWGVPPSQAGIPHAAGLNSGSTGQNETEVLMTGPVHDRVVAITEVIQFDLLDRWKVAGISAELEIEEPTYDDQAPAYALASAALSQPLLNNERRKIIGWDPLPDYGPDGEPLGVGIWLPATITPMAQGMDAKGTTENPFPGAPAPKPKPVPPPSPFGTTIPPVPQLGAGATPPVPVPAAKAVMLHTSPNGFLGLRKVVDKRMVPAAEKAVQQVLRAQREDVANRLAHATPRQLKDESYWWRGDYWDRQMEKALKPYLVTMAGTVADQAEATLGGS